MLRLSMIGVLAMLAVACTGAPAGTPIVIYVTPPPGATGTPPPSATSNVEAPTQPPPQTVAPTAAAEPPTPVPTPAPTPTRRPTPVPQATSSATKDEPLLFVWSDGGYVTAQVVLPVENTGGTWIELEEYDSSFTIFDTDGTVTETGSFDAGAPGLLAPGATGYLVGEVFTDDYPRSAFDRVEADARYTEVNEPASALSIENTKVRRGSLGGVEATGQVRNNGDLMVDNADVVAIFFNANGEVIGYASGYAENIEAGGTSAFEISSDFAEISLGDIAETQFFATSWDF